MEIITYKVIAGHQITAIEDESGKPIIGLMTLFKDVPVTINLILYKPDLTPYTNTELSRYTWAFVASDDFDGDTPPQLRASRVQVIPEGVQIVLEDMLTEELVACLGKEKQIKLGAELTGVQEGADSWILQWPILIKNRRKSEGVPTAVATNYYTKAQTDSLLANLDAGCTVNGFEGAVTIAQGTGTSITSADNVITINATGVDAVLPTYDLSLIGNDLSLKKDGVVESTVEIPETIYTNGSYLTLIENSFDIDTSLVALKGDLPTKTSDLENDNGYITINDVPGGSGSSLYSPFINYMVTDATEGNIYYLDSTNTILFFVDRVKNLKKIQLETVSANTSITGNIILVPYLNDVAQNAIVVTVGTTQTITFSTAISGRLKLIRDYASDLDTLRQTIAGDVTCKVLSIRVGEE